MPKGTLFEIGSTAVEGLIGKQDLDFLVRVPAKIFSSVRATLDRRYDRNPDQLSNEIFQGYRVRSVMDVSVQLTVADGEYDDFLIFLSELEKSDALRREYNQLKRAFDGKLMLEYREAKHDFIQRVLALRTDD